MHLLKRKQPADGVARIEFYGDESGEIIAMYPTWDGADSWLVHLPAAVVDDHLAFIRFDVQKAEALADLNQRVALALEDPQADSWLFGVPLVDSPLASAYALDGVVTTEVRMNYPAGRFWAMSTEEPKAARSLLFTLTPQVCWDWVLGSLRHTNPDLLRDLLINLRYQCDYYDAHGIAADFRLNDVGKAAFYGSMMGASDRLRAEIAAMAGLTIDQYDNLPDDERRELTAQYTAQDTTLIESVRAELDRRQSR